MVGQTADPLSTIEQPSTSEIETLSYPENELSKLGHWVTFEILDSRQMNRSSSTETAVLKKIRLPMPSNLSEQLEIGYDTTTELGNFGSIIVDAARGDERSRETVTGLMAGAAVGGFVGALTGGNAMTGAVTGMIGSVAGKLTSTDEARRQEGLAVGAAGISEVLGQTGTLGRAIAGSFGIARNPHKVVLFSGVDFRTHSFSFDLIPKNYDEAKTIRKIIFLMKYHGSPSTEGLQNTTLPLPSIGADTFTFTDTALGDQASKHFFQYPNLFRIYFRHSPQEDDWERVNLFRLADCFLTRFSVNYHPANTPSYARPPEEGNLPLPTAVRIEMTFTETEILTREKVQRGY